MASDAPDILFHRYFQSRPRLRRDGYRGKADVDRMRDAGLPAELLFALQEMMNEALRHENVSIPEHARHDPFHFDYVDSTEPNALAFCSDGYSFIGITIPLLEQLWQSGVRLSDSADIVGICRITLDDSQRTQMTIQQRIQVVVFRLQLFFITLHEFTHVVHGHVRRATVDHGFADEIILRVVGNLESQAREADADGYAVYYMLANIVDSEHERGHLLNILVQQNEPIERQDQILISWLIVALAAYFCAAPPQAITQQTIYQRTHPPQAPRMASIMTAIRTWCRQNRVGLVEWLSAPRFQQLLRSVATAMWDMSGHREWSQQIEFLRSPEGRSYQAALDEQLKSLIKRGYRGDAA